MQRRLPIRSLLLAVLVASAALASQRESLAVRTVVLSEHPDDSTNQVYVKGQVVTVLRLDQPVNAAKTRMLGWEGRFEPLGVVGNKVILEPLRDLSRDEGIPLLVTLTDGTEIPFLLRPPKDADWWTDQQVNVFQDRETYDAMFSVLMDVIKEKRALEEQVENFRKEENSADHALATLLATGAIAQTPFKFESSNAGKDDDAEITVTVYRGRSKAAAVFEVKNLDPDHSWSLKSARLVSVTSGRQSTVAVHSTRRSIDPGDTGVVAVVADKSAFIEDGKLTSVFLELYRHDGMRQALVQLDPDLVAR
ncbi:DUF2381 family protein [Hyalangium versicolor]|uniref:DUF2381 family protein n=1 Tax=Hyalangium versicolor TaxID=2861190 RepID=UPI001CCA797D|nr:DUF2381 family protein [Hyalangium versicolor]